MRTCAYQCRPHVQAVHRRNPLAPRPPMRLRAHSGLRGIAQLVEHRSPKPRVAGSNPAAPAIVSWLRSEEHTSELQSLMRISYAVFFLNKKTITSIYNSLLPHFTLHSLLTIISI